MIRYLRSFRGGLLLACAGALAHCQGSEADDPVGSAPDAAPPESPPIAPPSVDAAPACLSHCSEDLHDVVDCQGHVQTHCTGNTACGQGALCVPVCEATTANRSNVGCEYVVPRPVSMDPNGCYALLLTNVWTEPATISVRFGASDPLDLTASARLAGTLAPLPDGKIPPGEVAIIALAGAPTGQQPGSSIGKCGTSIKPLFDDTSTYRLIGRMDTGPTTAFVVTSDVPLAAHAHDPLAVGWVMSKTVALLSATSAWGTDYVISGPVDNDGYAWMQLVGNQDGTVVEISPSQPMAGGNGLPGAERHEVRSITLARGEVAQFSQWSDLTGSRVHANKPIGAFAGAKCFTVGAGGCDAANNALMPVQTLGNQYVAVRYRDRYEGVSEKVPWRVVATVGGTKLTFDPAPPPNTPATLEAGEYFEFETDAPFIVSSQDIAHPFSVFGYMRGDPTSKPRGGPEFTQLISTEQFLRDYRFYTDPGFPETNIVVIRKRGTSGFADVSLDCAGKLTGFAPVGSSGEYEFTRIDVSRGNFEPVGNCKNGVHEMHSTEPFTATVWSWGSDATGTGFKLRDGGIDGVRTILVGTAFPIGGGFRPINTVTFTDLQ